MNVFITGASGFLGKKLVQALLQRGTLTDSTGAARPIERIIACDITPPVGEQDRRVTAVCGDISDSAWLKTVLTPDIDSVFHLAAIVSSQAEQEFDLGMRINVDATRAMMEILRGFPQRAKMVITSSVAVFGGELPDKVPDSQMWLPQSSYGTQKALNDLLLSDYSRRGFLCGRSLRMPTIVVRPGKPNQAASSFASGIIREPLNGEPANCPVATDTRMWLLSPDKAIAGLIHAHELAAEQLNAGRVINMCGLSVSVQQMLDALQQLAGDKTAALVSHRRDPAIENIVNSWPGDFDATYATQLGFSANADFPEIIREYQAAYSR